MFGHLHDLHQQHKERHEGRQEGGRHNRRHHGDEDDGDDHNRSNNPYSQGQPQQHSQRPYDNDDDDRRPQGYGADQGRGYAPPSGPPPQAARSGGFGPQGGFDRGDYVADAEIERLGAQFQGQRLSGDDDDRRVGGRGQGGYAPPSGPPRSVGPVGSGSLGGLDRGDFASDADIDRMMRSGEFDGRRTGYGREEGGVERRGGQGPPRQGYETYGREGYEGDGERRAGQGPPRQGYEGDGERRAGQGPPRETNEYGRYDAPGGPPPGRGYQNQPRSQQGYDSGYGDRADQYGPSQTQGRSQYESSQGPPGGRGGNAPAGGFGASRDGEERYDSGRPTGDRTQPPRRGEADSYYNQAGERYAHVAKMAQEHGDEDPELYHRATQGLHEKIQSGRPQNRDDHDDEDYKTQVDAHRKAYGNDDHGPMDTDAIGAAAAMEAIKQTAAAAKSSKKPAGGFLSGSGSGSGGRAPQAEEEPAADRGSGSGGMQDKLMALAMSHAGKLFDKKNAGSSGDKSQDKAQAMQSAAATAMQLMAKYKTKGALDPSDMQSVMGLAMKML